MAASTYYAQVQQLYIAYFGRPADTIGLEFWAKAIDAANGSIAAVQAGFSASSESQALFGNKSTVDKVTSIYLNAFGRAPEPAGLAYWVALLDAGTVTQAQASWTIQQSAGAGDAAVVQAKLVAAQAFTAQIDTTAEIQGYQGTAAADSARAFLATVNSAATGATAVANAASALAAAVAVGGTPGTTFTLTTGADNFTGTANNDTFNGSIDSGVAAQNTLGAADKIVGGAGVDTLNVTVNTGISATNGADISGVEIVNIRNIGAGAVALDASTLPGVTTVTSDRSTGTLDVTGLAAGATIGLKGNTTTALGAVTAAYVATATAANIALSNGVVAATPVLAITGAGLTSATITSTGAANSLATNGINFTNGAVKAVTVDAQTNVSTGNITGLVAASAITVKGSGTANLGTLQVTNVTSVDASANTGGVTAVLNNVTTLNVIGSTGNDAFTTGAVLATGASVNAGAGTADRLVIADTTHLTSATAGFYKGFEVLQVANGVTADASLLSANNTIGTIIIADGAGATGVTGLSAAQAAAVQITSTGAGAITIGLTGATTAGQIDTVKATVTNTTAAGAAQNIDLTGVVLAGVEKLELTANGTAAATSGTVTLTTAAATSLDSIILKSTGVNSITIDGAHSATNLSVDASTSTGNTTINASAYAVTTGANLKGGSGNDVLIGSAGNDIINGGAGNDAIIVGSVTGGTAATATTAATFGTIGTAIATGSDVLTGGAGLDSFAIAHSSVANASWITDLNLGTNVVGGAVDGLWFNTATPATAVTIVTLTATQQTAVTGAATLAAAVDLVLATASGENNVAQFTYGTDTYIVTNGAAANATYTAAQDNLVKITGFTGVLDASDIHFV